MCNIFFVKSKVFKNSHHLKVESLTVALNGIVDLQFLWKILMIKSLKPAKMSSQNYQNGVHEWDEKLEQCPYYPSHQIRPTRFGHHLLQCRKALSKQPTSLYYHKIDDLVVCNFNSFHHIPKRRMEEHIKKHVTEIKEILKPSAPKVGTIDDGISNIMTGIEKLNAAENDDDWDDDTNKVPAYGPRAKADKMEEMLESTENGSAEIESNQGWGCKCTYCQI